MQFEVPAHFAVFGGSFNPVHVGHVAIVEALAAQPGVSQVLVVPARRSPFKGAQAPLPAALRWAMLRAALGRRPRVSLLDLELRRPPPSYTYDTLVSLAAAYPRARFRLALGWDAFRDFAGWHRAEHILEEAGLLVFGRAGTERPPLTDSAAWIACLPAAWQGRARPDAEGLADEAGRPLLRYLELDLPEISSTEVLQERLLQHVPEAARPLLADHWARAGAG